MNQKSPCFNGFLHTFTMTICFALMTSFSVGVKAQSIEADEAAMDQAFLESVDSMSEFSAESAAATVPDRFWKVDSGLYRGARPVYSDMVTLRKTYNVRTIISLDDNEEVVANEKAWAESLGMNFISVPLNSFSTPSNSDVDKVLRAMLIAKKKGTGSVFIHCRHGRDRTGIMVALYRVFYQGYQREVAYREARNKGFRWFLFPLKRYFYYRTAGYP